MSKIKLKKNTLNYIRESALLFDNEKSLLEDEFFITLVVSHEIAHSVKKEKNIKYSIFLTLLNSKLKFTQTVVWKYGYIRLVAQCLVKRSFCKYSYVLCNGLHKTRIQSGKQ